MDVGHARERPREQPAARLQPRGEARHLRLVPGDGVRVVRLLPVCHARAVLRGAVLPQGQRHRGAALGLRDLRRRLPRAALRRAGLRAHRGPRRPQVHLPDHDRRDGLLDFRCRAAADLRDDRLGCAGAARDLALPAGPGARRRVRRRRDLRRRARLVGQARHRHILDPDHGHAGLLPGPARDRARARQPRRQGLRRVGLAHPVLGLGAAARSLGLHPSQA